MWKKQETEKNDQRLFRSDWTGKIQRKVVFYRWWDRQGETFSRKSFLVPALFGAGESTSG